MSLEDQIADYLRQHPDQKARKIAESLGVDRREVNSQLYRAQGRRFKKLDSHSWRLMVAHQAETVPAEPEAPKPVTPLGRLCRYYLSCLAKDVDRDLSEFASSNYGSPAYAELTGLPALPHADEALWHEPDVQRLLAQFRQERRQLALYVGYPARLVHIRSRSGWEGYRVEALMAFELKYEPGDRQPVIEDVRPEINLRALRQLTGVDGPDVFDESLQLQEELGLDSQAVDPHDLEDIFSALPEVRPEWLWQEVIAPARILRNPPMAGLQQPGLYNRAILLTAERSPFTKGLETELKQMETMPADRYHDTALGAWLSRHIPDTGKPAVDDALLEVLPLNSEQRQAVQRSLTRPLTVITGPPGTGKSQVVTSIIVNCAWRGVKVLFASKNNKAVDVVEARVNAIGPRPLLLRLGANEYQNRLAEYLTALLAATTDPQEVPAYEQVRVEHRRKLAERESLQRQLDDLMATRNRVDQLEQQVEAIRELVGPACFRAFRDLDLTSLVPTACTAERLATGASKRAQGLMTQLFWPLIRKKRVQAAIEATVPLRELCPRLDLQNIPATVDDGAPLRVLMGALIERLAQAGPVQTYFQALTRLGGHPTTGAISEAAMRIDRDLADVCDRLWKLWLRLQPSRLTPDQRRLLSDYKALLEMISGANEAGRKLGGGVFRRFYDSFPQLTSILPAWAVTNLSARGRLPMEPGFFDLLIIDEASQCDIASVLPLLYRCRRAVIIGDPQQLRHITQISGEIEHQLLQQHEIIDLGARWSYTANSVFDLAAGLTESGGVVALRDHHRSDARIIGFSNEHFYEGRLRVATRYDRLVRPAHNEPAVRWVQARGEVRRPPTGGAVNLQEAQAVVAELERLLVDQRYPGTIGVVSPFRVQANRIRDLVHQNERIMSAIGRSELLIDTVYKFQGDERDVIIFSPVVSQNTPKTALGFLGGNPNTFNVAVTRARAALVVVGDQGACADCGVRHLMAFARYAADGQAGVTVADAPRAQDFGAEYPEVSNPQQVSDWERFFYRELYRCGLRPIPQYSVEQYMLDFAVVRGNRRLDIEVDGETYHRAWNGELAWRDQIRNRRLIELGWDVMRFWVYQIRDETQTCVERVIRWYNSKPGSRGGI